MELTVHQVSQKLNISPDTIRRWDKKGLIKSYRSDNNHRLFNYTEVETLKTKLQGGLENKYQILKSESRTNYNAIELFAGAGGTALGFAGAGGTALGFENAGINHVLLNEIDKTCAETLKKNFPHNNIVCDDVKKIDFTAYKGIDIVQAGFPCQAFSYAGKSLGFEDTRGTLFFEFARCIKETMPKIAIGENVRGLVNHDNGRTLQTMLKVLDEIGYKVQYKVLRAQYLDVPQKRERLIIIGIRKDLDIPFIFPKERNYTVSLREAFKNCPDSEGQKYPVKKAKVMEIVPEGGYWKDLPIEVQKEYMGASFFHTGGRTGMARRLSFDEPSLTLTCSPAQKQTERCHPSETRPLNVREYARIQTFPDNWQFAGSMTSKYKQIGNAVPCNLAYHIGTSVIKMLDLINSKNAFTNKENFDVLNYDIFSEENRLL